MNTFTTRAVKWEYGWELHIEGEGTTQVRTLDKAVQQVRDYLETVHGVNYDGATIQVIPELPHGLDKAVEDARRTTHEAIEAQERAAARSREVVRELRNEGLSVTDTAAVLGVSRGRVSQLTRLEG